MPPDNVKIKTTRQPDMPDGRHRFTFDVTIDPRFAASIRHPAEIGQHVFDALLDGLRKAMKSRRGG